MKRHDTAMDVIRIVAMLMVVFYHSPMGDGVGHGFFLGAMTFIVRPCIGLFLMISGALLLPVKLDGLAFVKKRLNKVVFPTLFWSCVYILLYDYRDNGAMSFLGLPFDWQGHPILWYMYTLIGLYLLAPIISPWLGHVSRRELEFYLILWCVTLLYPYIELFTNVNTTVTGILYYFTGYAGYFLLGFYMKKYGGSIKVSYLFILAALMFTLPAIYRMGYWPIDQELAFGYLSPVMVIIAAAWYILIQRLVTYYLKNDCINAKITSVLQSIAALTFGGYLIHVFVLEEIVWKFLLVGVHSFIAHTLLSGCLTFGISLLICHILSYLPFAKYLLGYQIVRENQTSKQSGGG